MGLLLLLLDLLGLLGLLSLLFLGLLHLLAGAGARFDRILFAVLLLFANRSLDLELDGNAHALLEVFVHAKVNVSGTADPFFVARRSRGR